MACELKLALERCIETTPKTSTPHADATIRGCQLALGWMRDNSKRFEMFASTLLSHLNSCFKHRTGGRIDSQAAREKMWTKFQAVRTSPEFKSLWESFFLEAGVTAPVPAVMYQSVSDKLFQYCIQQHCPLPTALSFQSDSGSQQLTYEEENALRYAAGYVLKSVRKKASMQKALQQAIDTIAQNGSIDDTMSTKWLCLVDRGGLVNISDDLYCVFLAIELEVRKHFKVEKAHLQYPGTNPVQCVMSNEDVLFFWNMVSSTIQEEVADEVLKRIVELYVTIRGFSFAKSYLEIYKQKNKKRLQKSKSLRKKVADNE